MDAKCDITSCDVLDIGVGIVNELAFGIDCETAKYCNFAQFYIENDLQDIYETVDPIDEIPDPDPYIPEIPDPDDPDPDNPKPIIEGKWDITYSFTEYVCVEVSEPTTTSTTTTTTTTQDQSGCYVAFTLQVDYEITTTSTTTTTTTTAVQGESCNTQLDILEITWD